MRVVKQSTATTVMLLMVESANHIVGKTGLNPSILLITIGKDGTPFAPQILKVEDQLGGGNYNTIEDMGNGWYRVHVDAQDLDRIGDVVLHATATGADPSERLLVVESATPTTLAAEIAALVPTIMVAHDKLRHPKYAAYTSESDNSFTFVVTFGQLSAYLTGFSVDIVDQSGTVQNFSVALGSLRDGNSPYMALSAGDAFGLHTVTIKNGHTLLPGIYNLSSTISGYDENGDVNRNVISSIILQDILCAAIICAFVTPY